MSAPTPAAPPPLRPRAQRDGGEAIADPASIKRLVNDIGLAFAPGSYDANTGECDVVWSTGAAVRRYDWWSDTVYMEVLDLQGADLTRLNAGAPLLLDHEADVESIVGSVIPGSARIEAGQALARVRFDRTSSEGQMAEAKVAAGHLRFVSCGYWVTTWEKTETDGLPVTWTARAWLPGEISLCPVPADAGAGLRAAGPAAAPPSSTRAAAVAPNQEAIMAEVNQDPAGGNSGAAPVETRAAPAAPPKPAPASVAELRALATRAGLAAEWVLEQAEAGITLDAARDLAIDAQAAQRAAPTRPAVQVVSDESEHRRAGMVGWLLHRSAPGQFKLEGPATNYRGLTLMDLARECLEAAGHRTRGWAPSEIARGALNLPGTRAGGTASDFPNLLGNYQAKRLMGSYNQIGRNFQAWARRRDLPDFKTAQTVELGTAPVLQAVSAQGSINYGQFGEAGETWALARYARNVSLSYVSIQNDDLGGFDRIPQGFATAAASLESTTVYGILAANANMSDGNALFSAAHANDGSGALSVANFAATRTRILRQTDATGQQVVVAPNVLIVPTELEVSALALFTPNVVPTVQSTTGDAVNPYRGSTMVVSSQFLTDANDWFVTVESGTGYEAVEYGYEMGMEGPSLASFTDVDVDGITFSCRHSFGAKAVTWRTIARSAN